MNKPPEERFWNKVDITDGCWEWKGSTNNRGYGSIKIAADKTIGVHRFAYSLMYGSIPEGMCICHHCDNPRCVKPSHLFLGTRSDNMKDSVAKGRMNNRGEENPNSRLFKEDVYEIRRLHSLGVPQKLLSKMWEIASPQINRIVRMNGWKHI